ELREHAQEPARRERGRTERGRAVGDGGRPGAASREVVVVEVDLELRGPADVDLRRPGEAPVGLDAHVVLAGRERPRDEGRDAQVSVVDGDARARRVALDVYAT